MTRLGTCSLVALPVLLGGCGGGSQSTSPAALVRAEVERLEDGGDREIEIDEAKVISLSGLHLYNATVMVPDHPGYHCAVAAKKVWCDGEVALANVVKELALGAKPDQLTDPQWIALVTFLTGDRVLATAGKAQLLEGYATAEARAEIAPPRVDRSDAGLNISYYVEQVSYGGYPSGPMRLARVTTSITPGNSVTAATEIVWSNDGPTCEPGQRPAATDSRFDCVSHEDCTNSCEFGAINKRWFAILGPGCKDGCDDQESGPPQCVDGKCVAFGEDGSRRDSCTNLPAPEEVCVPE